MKALVLLGLLPAALATFTDSEYWAMSLSLYSVSEGGQNVSSCDDGHARVYALPPHPVPDYPGTGRGECIFVFAGSETIQDTRDAFNSSIAILPSYTKKPEDTLEVHGGFHSIFSKLETGKCKVAQLMSDWGCRGRTTFVGHSAGGSVSELFAYKYNETTVTFGATPTFHNSTSSCVKGSEGHKRFYREDDPVPGGYAWTAFTFGSPSIKLTVQNQHYGDWWCWWCYRPVWTAVPAGCNDIGPGASNFPLMLFWGYMPNHMDYSVGLVWNP